MPRGLADDNALLASHLQTQTTQRAAARRLLDNHCTKAAWTDQQHRDAIAILGLDDPQEHA